MHPAEYQSSAIARLAPLFYIGVYINVNRRSAGRRSQIEIVLNRGAESKYEEHSFFRPDIQSYWAPHFIRDKLSSWPGSYVLKRRTLLS